MQGIEANYITLASCPIDFCLPDGYDPHSACLQFVAGHACWLRFYIQDVHERAVVPEQNIIELKIQSNLVASLIF